MCLGSVHQHSAADEDQDGYCYEKQGMKEHGRVSESKPGCFGERDIYVEEYYSKQYRERHCSYKLVLAQEIFGELLGKNHLVCFRF